MSLELARAREQAAPDAPANPIWQALAGARDDRPQLFCWQDGRYAPFTWDQWRARVERIAAGLRRRGIGPGARVATVLTNGFDAGSAVLAAWLLGAVVLSLPTLRRGMSVGEYREQLRELCRDAHAQTLLLEDKFIEMLSEPSLGVPVYGFASLPAAGKVEGAPLGDEDLAFVQYSSGSTSEPKGCLLTLAAIAAQERMLAERLEVDGDSRGVSWLPLSHDMGLFGCLLLSFTSGMRLALGSPERFLRKPSSWLDDCADFNATITVTPNFGLALATRRARERPPKASAPMRSVVLGGERIEWSTLCEADAVLGRYGISLETLTPAYGLAEATLAVSMKRLGHAPHAVGIDGAHAHGGELRLLDPDDARARPIVCCGPAVAGASVRIEQGTLGRIRIASDALAHGYLDRPRATAERFTNERELISEDIGFIHRGELYVVGRVDDVISIAGRKLHARDVELAVERCPGVRPGCSALVEVPAPEMPRLVLLAETTSAARGLIALAETIATRAFCAGGARVAECVFLQAGTLPKTPSGKVQRFRARQQLLDEQLAVAERVSL